MKKFLAAIPILYLLYPFAVFAVTQSGQLSNTRRFFESLQDLIDTLIPIVFALALLVFFWGVVKYIWRSGSEKEEGKRIMFWGIIALFIMTSVWGIVEYIGDIFGVREKTEVTIPTIKK